MYMIIINLKVALFASYSNKGTVCEKVCPVWSCVCDFKIFVKFVKILERQVHPLVVLVYHTQYECLTFMIQDHCLFTDCHLQP